jgi:hypothetical protein
MQYAVIKWNGGALNTICSVTEVRYKISHILFHLCEMSRKANTEIGSCLGSGRGEKGHAYERSEVFLLWILKILRIR